MELKIDHREAEGASRNKLISTSILDVRKENRLRLRLMDWRPIRRLKIQSAFFPPPSKRSINTSLKQVFRNKETIEGTLRHTLITLVKKNDKSLHRHTQHTTSKSPKFPTRSTKIWQIVNTSGNYKFHYTYRTIKTPSYLRPFSYGFSLGHDDCVGHRQQTYVISPTIMFTKLLDLLFPIQILNNSI